LLPKVRRGYDKDKDTERWFYYFYPRTPMRYPNCPADDDLAGWLALMLDAAFFAPRDFRSNISQEKTRNMQRRRKAQRIENAYIVENQRDNWWGWGGSNSRPKV
jgi:hypothetical protein